MMDLPWYVRATFAAGVLVLLSAALGLSYLNSDDSNRNIIVGAIIAQFATVVGYYFGSSESSRKKDETLAAATTALATSTPTSPVITTTETDAQAGTARTTTEPVRP